MVACYRPLWELAFELELLCPADSGRSRKRDHRVFDWLLLHVAASLLGGVRKGARELSNPELWAMLQQAVIRAWPHSTGFRLGDCPISRTQYWYFRAHHLSGEMVEQMVSKARDAGARTGLWMGLFDPAAGSLARPDKTQMVAGDATWIETLFRVDPDGGEGNSHFDVDAIQYHHSQQDRPARGHKAMILLARHPYRSERVILAAEVAPPGTTEGNWFCDRIEGLVECHPQIAPGLNAAVYDMALGAAHRDRLLDMGIVPIGKIRRTKTGDPAAMNIGVHIFANNKTGESDELGITAVDGTPCVVYHDHTGKVWYVPLDLKRVQRRKNRATTMIYAAWALPDHALVPLELVGAVTWIRHNSTTQERSSKSKHHRRRTRALSVFPETTKQFRDLFGLREDVESANSHLKDLLAKGRARSVGANNIQLDLTAHQIFINIVATCAHADRTRKPTRQWLGTHIPQQHKPQPANQQTQQPKAA